MDWDDVRSRFMQRGKGDPPPRDRPDPRASGSGRGSWDSWNPGSWHDWRGTQGAQGQRGGKRGGEPDGGPRADKRGKWR